MEQIDTEATPPRPLTCSQSLTSEKGSDHTDEVDKDRELPETPAEKRRNWRLFRRKKKGSTTSITSKKSILTLRRKKSRKRQGSENLILPRKLETDLNEQRVSHQLLERTQRSKSFESDGKRSRANNRVRSNSSYRTNRTRRRGRKRREQDDKERKKITEMQIKNCLDNLCTALVEKDKELFTGIFTDDEPEICYPVGILKETNIVAYFKHFVEAYAMVDPILETGSVVLDLRNTSAHCEVRVASKYANSKGSTKYEEPQHWHFDFEVSYGIPDQVEDSDRLLKAQSKVRSSETFELTEKDLSIEVLIKRWHVYSSLSRYRKITSRTFGDVWSASKNWIALSRQYGVSYVGSQLVDAFSTEKTPIELTEFLKALNSYSPIALEKCFSPVLKTVVVEGLFSYYAHYEKNARVDLKELVQIILKQFDKQRVQQIKCISVFRCSTRISARLVLNVRRELVPAFLMLRMTGDKSNSANNKVKEMLFCSPNT